MKEKLALFMNVALAVTVGEKVSVTQYSKAFKIAASYAVKDVFYC